MKLRNKLLLLFLFLVFLFIVLNFNAVHAVEYDGQLPAFSSLSSEYNLNNYCIWTCEGITYLALSNDSEFMVIGGDYYCLTINGVVFKNIDNEWVLFKEHLSDDKTWDFPLIKRGTIYPDLSDVIYFSNVRVYHDSGGFSLNAVPIPDNYVFFQRTVVLTEGVQELPKVIVETLKIIIPVGLVILGIGFVIYLIKLVILRVI